MKTISIILALFPVFIWTQTSVQLEEKLKSYSREERPALLNQIAQASHTTNPDITIRYGLEALNLAKWQQNPVQEGQSHHSLGLGYQAKQNPEQALEHFYQALDLFLRSEKYQEQAEVLRSLGNFFIISCSNYNEAQHYYDKALNILKKHPHQRLTSALLNNRASVFTLQGQYDKALADMLESLKIKEEEADTPELAFAKTWNNIGMLFFRLEDKENALLYLNRSLAVNRRHNTRLEIARNLLNIGTVLVHFEDTTAALEKYSEALTIGQETKIQPILINVNLKFGELELAKNHLPEALNYYKTSHQLSADIGSKDIQALSLLKMGEAHERMKNMKEAESCYLQGLSLAESFGGKETIRDTCKSLAELYRKIGNSTKSVQFYKRYDDLTQAMFSPVVSTSIRNIQIKYEKSKLEKFFSRQKSFWMQLLILSGFLIIFSGLIATTVFLNRQRLKRKAIVLLREKNEEIKSHRNRIAGLQEYLKEFLAIRSRPKYEKSNLTEEEATRYLKTLIEFMKLEKPYLDSDLTVTGLANKVNIPAKALSQVINEKLGKNYNDFINQYRLETARDLLLTTSEQEWSMIDIAFEAGFNSKSSFNTLFKKHFGVKPSEFRRRKEAM